MSLCFEHITNFHILRCFTDIFFLIQSKARSEILNSFSSVPFVTQYLDWVAPLKTDTPRAGSAPCKNQKHAKPHFTLT